MIAFWQYLKRVYLLSHSDDILDFLHEIEPEFKDIMTDPSNFGMAKSFFMAGQAAGFDMTDQEESQRFMALYNASLLSRESRPQQSLPEAGLWDEIPGTIPSRNKAPKSKKKRLRKLSRASRRKNRKKRKR